MNFSGSDLLRYLTDILEDFQNLGSTDLVGLGVRVVVLFFGAVFFVLLVKFLWRVFWDTFGGLFRWLWRMVSAPVVVPWFHWKQYRSRKQYRKQMAEQHKAHEQKRQQERAEAEAKARREAEIFERIMK